MLSSARYGWYRKLAREFIDEHDLPIEVPAARLKPQCDVFVDDRNLGCGGIDWLRITRQLLATRSEGGLI